MPRFLPRRWRYRALLALAVALVALGVTALVIVLSKPGNVSHPNLQFTSPTTARTVQPPPRRRTRRAASFLWPWYGYDAARTRDFVAPPDLRPPLHVGWEYTASAALLEFPPSIENTTMVFLDDDGFARALDDRTGHILWTRRVGTLAAATPAIARAAGLALMPVLSDHGHSPGGGRFVALHLASGRIAWSAPVPAGSESSPIVAGNSVYYGDSSGALEARDVRTGALEWSYHAHGAIKGGPALAHGILFFGDYSGRAYAVHSDDGRLVWSRATNGAHFGLGSGQFYATPAIAYGRVYLGSTDHRVYSFGARNGALAWATETGAYVYASAAVADPRGLGPTLYVGSYDGDLYAFNAQSGKVRWKHPAGGRISGSATVIGNVVYYADLGTHTTTGLDVRTGRRVFSWPDGAFTPVLADDHAIYLVGYAHIYELLPGRRPRRRAHRRRSRPRAVPHRAHQRRHRPAPRRPARGHRPVVRHRPQHARHRAARRRGRTSHLARHRLRR